MNEILEFVLKGYCGLTPEPDIRRVKGDDECPTRRPHYQAGVRAYAVDEINHSCSLSPVFPRGMTPPFVLGGARTQRVSCLIFFITFFE